MLFLSSIKWYLALQDSDILLAYSARQLFASFHGLLDPEEGGRISVPVLPFDMP